MLPLARMLALIFTFFLSSLTAGDYGARAFSSTCATLSDTLLKKMPYSVRKDGPVAVENLRYITVLHYTFEGTIATGELVVHESVALDITEIFGELFEAMFPIKQLKLIDEYEGSDGKSIQDNNSYALYMRNIARTDRWSNHAYGMAIDINPWQNPYIEPDRGKGGKPYVEPINEYVDRTHHKPGMIHKNSIIYKAFTKRGWLWGGECFDYCLDLHHFQKNINGLNKNQN